MPWTQFGGFHIAGPWTFLTLNCIFHTTIKSIIQDWHFDSFLIYCLINVIVCLWGNYIWNKWAAFAKRSLMSWVIVIPKEGWMGNKSILLLVWHQLFRFFFEIFFWNFVIPKEGWTGPFHIMPPKCQWGTFSVVCDAFLLPKRLVSCDEIEHWTICYD